MSSLLIIGFFALASGRRLAITKPGAKSRTWYCYYSTTIQTSTGNILPADLRIYSPINDVVHPDNTIAFVIAKAYIPPNDTTFLDVLHLAICPGDPSSESYEESLPDCPYPWIFGVGHVPSKSETLTDTNTKIFPVSHTEYVRESSRNSYVICAYDGDAPRWTNTPAPLPQACVQYFGICHSVLPNGHLRVNVESIILSLVPLSSPDQSTISTPTRKRKFQAIASPSTASKITINSIPPVSASSSMSVPSINASSATLISIPLNKDALPLMQVPLGNPASSSALTMPNYGASSSMSVPLQSVPPVDINMHPDSGAAPSPLSTIDDFEADESLPPVASQSSKAKGKKKAKF